MKPRKKHNITPYQLVAPAFILVLALLAYTIIDSLRLSLIDYNLLYPSRAWNGFANYTKILGDAEIPLILFNTLKWVVIVVMSQFLLGLGLAHLLNRRFVGKSIYNSLVFLPWATPAFLIAFTFKWIFNEHNGVVNYLLMQLGWIKEPISWMGTEQISLVAPIISMIWFGVPFFGIMLLAALQSIPLDIYESCRLEGAGPVTTFFRITLPYVKPTIIITLLLRVIWVFNSPDIIYIITGGGPANSSSTLSLYIFNQAFYSMDFGYGAAVGILMLLFLVIYALFYLKTTNYSEAGDF